MRVVLSTIGKFHTFDLARELEHRGALTSLFTGYPRFKIRGEQLPEEKVKTFPWLHAPYMACPGRDRLGRQLNKIWEQADRTLMDHYVARRMPPHDVFVGLSGAALRSGKQAHAMGARYVCDRGSSHIRAQDRLLQEEHAHWSLPYAGISPQVIDQEEAEYEEADCITVPSGFSVKSFVDQGVPREKLRLLPYGVNLGNFAPAGTPASGALDILFTGGASLRKGIPYLLQAYKKLDHPNKSLAFAGSFPAAFREQLRCLGLWSDDIQLLGHLTWPQLREHMSKSTVLVLPSIEDGFGLVMAQAMACGCPVIASEHTGAGEMVRDGETGFIVPIRRADVLADRLMRLADEPDLRGAFSAAGLKTVQQLGGWRAYGDRALNIYQNLLR